MSVADDASIAKPETKEVAARPRSILPLLVVVLVLVGGFFFGRNFLHNAQETGEEQARTAMRKFMRAAFRTDKQTAVADGVGTEEAQKQAAAIVKERKGLVAPRSVNVKTVGTLGNSAEGEVEAVFAAGSTVLLLKSEGGKVVEVKEKPGAFNDKPSGRPSLGTS